MKTYNLKVGQYGGFADIQLEIPDEIFFFYNKGEIGNGNHVDAEHYHTVVRTKKYKAWLKKINSTFGLDFNELGEYTIVSIISLHNSTPVPTIDREEWFKQNNIDFTKYVIVNKDYYLNILNVCRIHEFISPWTIKHACVTRRDFFSRGEWYSMNEDVHEFSVLVAPTFDSHTKTKILEGKEAEELWNSMIYQVLLKVGYDSSLANKEYNFDKERNEALEMFEKSGFNNIVEMIRNNE